MAYTQLESNNHVSFTQPGDNEPVPPGHVTISPYYNSGESYKETRPERLQSLEAMGLAYFKQHLDNGDMSQMERRYYGDGSGGDDVEPEVVQQRVSINCGTSTAPAVATSSNHNHDELSQILNCGITTPPHDLKTAVHQNISNKHTNQYNDIDYRDKFSRSINKTCSLTNSGTIQIQNHSHALLETFGNPPINPAETRIPPPDSDYKVNQSITMCLAPDSLEPLRGENRFGDVGPPRHVNVGADDKHSTGGLVNGGFEGAHGRGRIPSPCSSAGSMSGEDDDDDDNRIDDETGPAPASSLQSVVAVGGTTATQLPHPMYPWMRSHFGK